MLTRKLRRLIFKREGKKMPLMAPPLRQAGQGAGQAFDEKLLDIILAIVGTGAFTLILLVIWVSHSLVQPSSVWAVTGGALLLVWLLFLTAMCILTRKSWAEAGDYHLGWLAECVVGEALEACRKDFSFVFHDIVEDKPTGDQFNIDHVAIGEAGVFVFETKGRRKPEKGDVTISYDGNELKFADGSHTDDPIRQVKANAKHIHDRLLELLKDKRNRKFEFHPDRPAWVRPVLVYPGWMVKFQDFHGADFNVVTEKTLANFVGHRPKVLSAAEVNELGQLLGGSLRQQRAHLLQVDK